MSSVESGTSAERRSYTASYALTPTLDHLFTALFDGYILEGVRLGKYLGDKKFQIYRLGKRAKVEIVDNVDPHIHKGDRAILANGLLGDTPPHEQS